MSLRAEFTRAQFLKFRAKRFKKLHERARLFGAIAATLTFFGVMILWPSPSWARIDAGVAALTALLAFIEHRTIGRMAALANIDRNRAHRRSLTMARRGY